MRKLLAVLVLMVSMVLLVGCQAKQPDILVIEVDKEFQDYDYMVGEILTRNISIPNKGYKYTIELEDGQTGEVYSDELFSIGEKVLVIEYDEGKAILIDLD